MPTLIKLNGDVAAFADDSFVTVTEEEQVPTQGDVIVSLQRFLAEGDALTAGGRKVGVVVQAGEAVEDLAYDLPRLALVAVAFPKYRDGRGFSSARVLRDRYGYKGEVRAVGDVLLEQANILVRCGFDAFEVADGTGPEAWTAAVQRYRHVYQRAADGREPAYVERAQAQGG